MWSKKTGWRDVRTSYDRTWASSFIELEDAVTAHHAIKGFQAQAEADGVALARKCRNSLAAVSSRRRRKVLIDPPHSPGERRHCDRHKTT
jgi:hypothetical protein